MRNNPIGVFDSGVGGLNVLYRCSCLLPCEKFIYLADEANMPYGTKTADDIRRLALERAQTLFDMNCKALVIACNTATVNAIDDIRRLYGTRVVVGLEPAVKPCYRELGKNGYAVALVTSATYGSTKFERLLASCDGRIVAEARPELAGLIERHCDSIDGIAEYVFDILRPYADAEAVILGCSHYTYITDIIRRFYGGKIKIYDGAQGEAERLRYCLELSAMLTDRTDRGNIRFYSTHRVQ